MTMSEDARHRLYNELERVLGSDEARTLMEHVPAEAASELVTKDMLRDEFALFRAEIRTDFAEFRAEMRQEFAEFRGAMRAEFAEFQGEMRAEFAEFQGEMRAEFAEFRGEVRAALREQGRTLFLALVGLQISAAGLVVAALHLT